MGGGFFIDPEAPGLRDEPCSRCRGVGVVENGRSLDKPDFWFALTVMVACLPATWVRDVIHFGLRYANLMWRVHWVELRSAWGARPWGDMPEVGEEWFKRARLRRPDKEESK
jgi:hypothetical protein